MEFSLMLSLSLSLSLPVYYTSCLHLFLSFLFHLFSPLSAVCLFLFLSLHLFFLSLYLHFCLSLSTVSLYLSFSIFIPISYFSVYFHFVCLSLSLSSPLSLAPQETVESTGYSFSCIHGAEECTGNIMMMCAKYNIPTVEQYMSFSHCIMDRFQGVEATSEVSG